MFLQPINSFEGQYYAWFVVAPYQSQPAVTSSFTDLSSPSFGAENLQIKDACSPLSSSQRVFESQTSISSEQKLKEKSRRRGKGKIDEEQFNPNNPEGKKQRKTPQNSNRNVIPNIMHQVVSFLQKKYKSEQLVQKLIDKLNVQQICTVKRFYFYQILIKQKLNHYVNAQSLGMFKDLQQPLCEVYSESQQRHYNKISLLLIRYFLTKQFDVIILTSKRVSSNKKLDHLVTKRRILEQLEGMFTL